MEKVSAIEGWTKVLAQVPRPDQLALAERIDLASPPDLFAFCMDEVARLKTKETLRLVDVGFFEKAMLIQGALLTEEARLLHQALTSVIADFDLKILSAVTDSQRVSPDEAPEWEMNRILDIVSSGTPHPEVASDSSPNLERLNILLLRFARAPYAAIRSRAVKIIGEASCPDPWFERMMKDLDPRVRSSALEVMGHLKGLNPLLKGLVSKAAEDHHYRVQTTALLVLAKFGDGSAAARIVELLSHRNENFRKAARWALRALAAAKLKAKNPETEEIPISTRAEPAASQSSRPPSPATEQPAIVPESSEPAEAPVAETEPVPAA